MSENEIDTMFKQEKTPSDNSNNSSVVSSIILSAIANETVDPHANGLSDSDDNKEDDESFNRYRYTKNYYRKVASSSTPRLVARLG